MSGSTHDKMSGFRALGRFLSVGLVAGSVIGAVVGVVLVPGSVEFTVGAALIGSALGLVAGLLAQAVTFSAVLFFLRRASRRESVTRLIMYAPVPVAALTAWAIASWGQVPLTRIVAAVSITALLAFVVSASTAGWCLAPLSGSPSWPSSLRILRAVAGTAIAIAGVLMIVGELDFGLAVCNSSAPVMLARPIPPFLPHVIVPAGLLLAGWPRSMATPEHRGAPRRWVARTALSVLCLVSGPLLIVLALQRSIESCFPGETAQLSPWAAGNVVGPVLLAIGILAAVWPSRSPV